MSAKLKQFTDRISKYQSNIESLLQNKYGITAEEFRMTCINLVKKKPKLLDCDQRTLFGAILICAEIGLKPDTPDQHCFIIPRGNEACFEMGYKGLAEIMYRSPRVKKIEAEVVYELDEFDFEYGFNPFLKHKPCRKQDRGGLEATYCIVTLDDNEKVFTVVEKWQLDKIMGFSASYKAEKFNAYTNGLDVHNFMQIKAAVKKVSKLIPKQNIPEISKAVEYDSEFEGGATVDIDFEELESNPNEANISMKNNRINSPDNAFDDLKKANEDIKKNMDAKIKVEAETKKALEQKQNEVKETLKSENAKEPQNSTEKANTLPLVSVNEEDEIDAFGAFNNDDNLPFDVVSDDEVEEIEEPVSETDETKKDAPIRKKKTPKKSDTVKKVVDKENESFSDKATDNNDVSTEDSSEEDNAPLFEKMEEEEEEGDANHADDLQVLFDKREEKLKEANSSKEKTEKTSEDSADMVDESDTVSLDTQDDADEVPWKVDKNVSYEDLSDEENQESVNLDEIEDEDEDADDNSENTSLEYSAEEEDEDFLFEYNEEEFEDDEEVDF